MKLTQIRKGVYSLKCKKHGISMEFAPGGHFYCPECEAVEEGRAINLCETCCMSFADCPTLEGGGDNVFRCDHYRE